MGTGRAIMETRLGVKEWSAVVDAIGRGEQCVLIRKYQPKNSTFFLYPTFSFYQSNQEKPEILARMFQEKHLETAIKAGRNTMFRGKTEFLVDITHFVKVEETIKVLPNFKWEKLKDFFIWTPQHVEDYASGKKAEIYIWLAKAFQLAHPFTIGRVAQGGPPAYYNHHEDIQLEPHASVLDTARFNEVKTQLTKILSTSSAPLHTK